MAAEDPNALLCSDSKLFNPAASDDQNLTESLLEDAFSFACSFVKNRPITVAADTGDVSMTEESKQGGAGCVSKGPSEHAETLKLYEINFEEVE